MDGHKYARSHGEWIRVEIGGSPLYEISAISEMVEFIIPIKKACAGDTVEFSVVPAGGYRINTVSIPGATNITNKSENGFGVREYAFTMPSQNVVISATLVTVKFNVTPVQKNIAEGRNTGNGYINVSPLTDVPYNDIVTVICNADSTSLVGTLTSLPSVDFRLKSHTNNGKTATYEFNMPSSDIIVTIPFFYSLITIN